MTTRRDLLKGGAVLSLSALVATPENGWAAETRPRFVIDSRLPEASHLKRHAELSGHPCADPEGEVIALLAGRPGWAGGSSLVIGLTGYVDYVLARDLFRSEGRRMRQVWQLGPSGKDLSDLGNGRTGGPLASLLGSPAAPTRRGATSFLWVA